MLPHLHLLEGVLTVSPPDLFPGQREEIKAMTNAHGCDIAEHVPTLIRYGRMCPRITEMGVRFGWSTRSFLFARPERLSSIDKYEWNSVHQSGLIQEPGNSQFKKYQKLYEGIVNFTYTLSDTTKLAPIPETDLLFIDTYHHASCLKLELELHGNSAKKFIILHDTETFGEVGQADKGGTFMDWDTKADPGTGLWYAIRPWLSTNPHWGVREIFRNNNGLTILEREGV